MHPHWYSASPEIQRRLISRYLRSIDTQPSPDGPVASALLSDFQFSSPHDVAAVLRWGLRHLRLHSDHFGTDEGWYKVFLEGEEQSGYPLNAFSDKLATLLPADNFDLLIATLEIFSSLAAHAEVNGASGSKLSKMFGLWLLTSNRVTKAEDWKAFYSRWEQMGRMLEHLFLARIRYVYYGDQFHDF